MNITFDLNLDHSYAESLRQQHSSAEAQAHITDLEDKIGAAVHTVVQRLGVLPAIGDRIEVDFEWMVITARSFSADGSVWLSVNRFEA
jgi:hypothetical protein